MSLSIRSEKILSRVLCGEHTALVKRHLVAKPDLSIEFHIPELLTPLIIYGNNRGALVGANNPKLYKNLVQFDRDNPYKFSLRQVTEEDLQNG
jgi:hypothetical protein